MPEMRTLKIFFHEACFDGVSSAAVFARFYREAIDPTATVVPVGMVHRDGDPFADVAFDGDDHACVDFRFSAAPKLRWWFDHHPTAFQPPSLREVFEERRSDTLVFDPTAPSCAGLIARTLHQTWSWQPPAHLRELATWADRVDSLDYDSAAAAVALATPAQRIAAFLSTAAPAQTARCVSWLERHPMADVATRPEVEAAAAQLLAERAETLAQLRHLAVQTGDVITLDLLAHPGSRAPGLLGYLLFPACRYVVSAVASPTTLRISAGHNPWHTAPSSHHIGELCQRYGGGGHAAVGGVTLAAHELPRAHAVVEALVRALAA